MPSFQPFVQRAGTSPTTISTPAGMNQRVDTSLNEPVNKDVRMRRQQRWVFYAIFILLFLAALILVLKVYADNTALVANVENLNATISQRNKDLEQLRQDLANRNQASESSATNLEDLKQQLANNLNDLQTAVAKNKDYELQLSQQNAASSETQLNLERAKANTLNIILTIGTELSAKDIAKIPVADIAVAGIDTDKDGLPDNMEKALGTDPLKADTDNDGYSDKEEIYGNFNPIGSGVLPIDTKFAAKYKGKIILNKVGDVFYGWYVAQDAKRYYLGSSDDKFEALRQNDYWTKGAEPVATTQVITQPTTPETTATSTPAITQ